MKNILKNKKIAVLALMLASTTFSTLAGATVTSDITTDTVASVKDANKGVVNSRWSVCFAGWCYSFV